MVTVAVVIAVAFILLWVRDKDRADEVADDPERAVTGPDQGPGIDRTTSGDTPDTTSERRS
jgi:hypothetical protein